MSYFSIVDFLQSGEKSLADKNYYGALAVALMLPSMCSRFEYNGNSDYCYTNKAGILCWRDRKAYVDFCNKCFSNNMWLRECFGRDVGAVLYNLRCDIVHAGCANIYDGDYAIWLSYGDGMSGVTCFSKYKIVNIESICRSIFMRVNSWIQESGVLNYLHTLVFSGSDGDDRLLYARLCDNERADALEQKFIEELAKRSDG